ncbi:MAG: Gfo/Idh/MocA family oxidoreductase [Caldilineaceae bacterium]
MCQTRIPTVHAGYDALLADPEIDAVYVPLPNNLHAAWSIKALEAGKHVLCEKPMAANGDEARAMARAADATGLALIEAFHYRYHPLAVRAREIVRGGELGAVQHIDAEFCTPSVRPHNIRFRYDLAGGATMDLGCYAIDMIRFLSGEELTVVDAQAKTASPQIDRAMRARFTLTSGATAAMLVSMRSSCVLRALIRVMGERGTMTVITMLLPHFLYTPAGRERRRTAATRSPSQDVDLHLPTARLRGASARRRGHVEHGGRRASRTWP